jgi:serine protease
MNVMRMRHWNRLIQALMIAGLLVTGYPLVQAVLPQPLPPLPLAANDLPPDPGWVVVDARDDLTPQDLQALNARHGLDLRFHSEYAAAASKLLVGQVPVGTEDAVVERLSRDRSVEAASRMHRFRTQGSLFGREKTWTPNDPRFHEQWNLKLIGAEKAWVRSRGKDIIVAVIDTGVAFEADEKCYRAQDFGGTRFVPGYDFVNRDEHPNDDHGHGTHVAGTIAETTDNGEGVAGLAFEASIMPLKVLDNWGGGRSADIADAIRWAADHGAHIINMSLGGPFPDPVMRKACEYASKKGVLIVCAAGNSFGGRVGYPAAFPECLAVSAVGPDGKLAPYSSTGKEVAIAGPGGNKEEGEEAGVLQNTVLDGAGAATDGYYAFQGTSMASPHVAATAALVMAMGIDDAAQARDILLRSAKKKGPATHYGAGILDAGKAVQLAAAAHRDSFLKLLVTLLAGLLGVGVGVVREGLKGLLRFPFVPLGFVLGALGPGLIFGWFGFGSPFSIILHSALIPLYFLWEAESRAVYRFVGAVALGMALHLFWDAVFGPVRFPGVLPAHAAPWLWMNLTVALGVALVAWRRSF